MELEEADDEGLDECGPLPMHAYPPFPMTSQRREEADSDATEEGSNLFLAPQPNMFDAPHPFNLDDNDQQVDEGGVDDVDCGIRPGSRTDLMRGNHVSAY